MLDEIFFSADQIALSFRQFHVRKRSLALAGDREWEEALSLLTLIQNHEKILKLAFAAIANSEYQIGPGQAHIILAGKPRTIIHFNWLDTFVVFHFARCLAEVTDQQLSPALFSYRAGKSSSMALNIVKNFVKPGRQPCFV